MATQPIIWIPRSDEYTVPTDPILEIHLVAYHPQIQTTKLTNHWSMFLRLAADKFVRLDPSPNYPNMDMVLSCCVKASTDAEDPHKEVRLATAKQITVGAFMKMLKEEGYHRYNFSDIGTGCRHWVHSVVELLWRESVVSEAGAAEAAVAIDVVWEDGKPVDAESQTSFDELKGAFVK